jgi:hypothetical protein
MAIVVNRVTSWKLYLPAIVSAGLLGASAIHRLQIDNTQAYRESPLIFVEVGCIVLIFCAAIAVTFMLVVNLLKQKWIDAMHAGISLLLAFILLGISVIVDSPTLLYAT